MGDRWGQRIAPETCQKDVNEEAQWARRLVEAAKQGQPGAFDALVRRYRPRVYALALHLSGTADQADDITQDVFVKALTNIGRFEGRSQFFTWLYRITLNRGLNARRDARRRRPVGEPDDRIMAAVAVDAPGDPRLALELREQYGLLLAAFDQLSPLLRTTVTLVALQGLSHGEAAVVLKTHEKTVSWRIHEARRRLRISLEKLARDPTPIPRGKRLLDGAEIMERLRLVAVVEA